MNFCPQIAVRSKNELSVFPSEVNFPEKETRKTPSKSKSDTSQAFDFNFIKITLNTYQNTEGFEDYEVFFPR